MHMGIFGHNFRVWTSTKHRPILYENNEKSFVFGGEIPFEAERIFEVFFLLDLFLFLLDFINFEKVILDILRPEIKRSQVFVERL